MSSYMKYGSGGKTYRWDFPSSPTDLSWAYKLNTSETHTLGGVVVQILSCSITGVQLSGQLPPRRAGDDTYATMDSFVKWIVGAMNHQESRSNSDPSIELHIDLSSLYDGSVLSSDRSVDLSVFINSYPGIARGLGDSVPTYSISMTILQGSSSIEVLTMTALGELSSQQLSTVEQEAIMSMREIGDVNWVRNKYNSVEAYGNEGDIEGKTIKESQWGFASSDSEDTSSIETYEERASSHSYALYQGRASIGLNVGFPWYQFNNEVGVE